MNRLSPTLRPEVNDLLQDACKDCFYARNALSQADQIKDDRDPVPQEAIDEAERINSQCIGWLGPENPSASLINAEGGPLRAMSESIDLHCPYQAAVQQNFHQQQTSE